MNPKVVYLAAGAVIGLVCAGWVGQRFARTPTAVAGGADAYDRLSLFGKIFEDISNSYVDEPDQQKLIKAAINGMMTTLDPHSGYVDGKGYDALQSMTKGEFGDIGIEVTDHYGLIEVVTTIDESSAAKAGVLTGDIISSINDDSAQGMMLEQAIDKLRGSVNSAVRLKILRGAAKDVKEFKIVRDIVRIQVVRSRIESNDIGYIRITQFTGETAKSLKGAMKNIRSIIPPEKFKGFILDLRNNPGGYVDQSIEVVNSFIHEGKIVSIQGRSPDSIEHFDARPDRDLSAGNPLVVLINGGSASAAEIAAGALQDRERATLIGTRSFGKGSVQTTIPLGQGGAVRLTTARYYTPSGRSIQARGVDPDIEVLEDVPNELIGKSDVRGEASLKGHLKNGDDEKTGSQAFVPFEVKEDRQLIAAVEFLHGAGMGAATPANAN